MAEGDGEGDEMTGAEVSLTHLNDDSSWLLTLPAELASAALNIVIDPWLSGPQVDYHPYFSRQSHAAPSLYPSLEALAGTLAERGERIDVVVITHEFTDHCHRETLEGLLSSSASSSAPPLIVVHPRAKRKIDGWGIFDRPVLEIPLFKPKSGRPWSQNVVGTSLADLARAAGRDLDRQMDEAMARLGIVYVPTDDPLDPARDRLHGATVLSLVSSPVLRYVVYSPHGVPPSALEKAFASLVPPSAQCLALVHGFDRITLPPPIGTINLGAEASGIPLVRLCRPRWWVRTHDERKKAEGLVAWLMRRTDLEAKVKSISSTDAPWTEVRVLASGESVVLWP